MWHRGRSEGHARSWRTLLPKPPSRVESVGAARRAVRVTVAAVAGFYPAVDLLDRPVLALYTLFIPVAFGLLSPLPGCGRRRAGTVLRAVPAAAALIVLGTYLAAASWSAALGMLLVGFVLVLGASIGSRAAGVVPALQLSYILASFPPYAPGTLPDRLAGLAVGATLTVLCEWLLLPEPRQPSYRDRVAGSLDLAAHAVRDLLRGVADGPETAEALWAACRDLRFSRTPAGGRPTGAGARDRALAQAGYATRRCLDLLAVLAPLLRPPVDLPSATLLRGLAAACSDTAGALRGTHPAPDPEGIEEMTAQYAAARGVPSDLRGDPHPLLSRQSALLAVAVSAVTVSAAVALATGRRGPLPGLPREQFWYAGASTARLWWVRIADHVTPRSVVFQNAVRTASGLALARLVAGSLDLSHGFWVLLGMLTLGRTTAGATWSAVRGAVAGTLVGSLAAGALLVSVGDATEVYAALLVPTALVAFWAGPVGGPAWGQGLFTLVVSMAFAQIAPVTWQLAGARIVDVLTGSVIGLVCGVLAWPAGARAEMRRSAADLFRTTAPLVRVTVERTAAGHAAPTSRTDAAPTLRRALLRWRIAHASYAQLRTEPPPRRPADGGPDWLAAINFGSRVLTGTYWVPWAPGAPWPPDAAAWARAAAEEVVSAALRAADFPAGGVAVRPAPLPPGILARIPAPSVSHLVDVEVWLHALASDLEAAVGQGDGVRNGHR
ncbi:FUSC family protein [Streptomyces sp. Vc74B-19]|uniref:FUSC family protein n=1 Tax=unclassified Streptomyces TaxID=2593676 RepID=UPI001BFC9975|nr:MULTISPECIES: FUSC family protein [unclassified Streptomyces]MBT3163874.1 FUSC family protein [Streptomyces sp. Vc74B-19]MCO4696345.1 FUSC family protein [Streptomyces sp. RO-S4]